MSLNNSVNLLLLISIITVIVNGQTTSDVVPGIGVGTLIIMISIAFSVVWCLACRSSSYPEIYSIIGVSIPFILILIFILMPKEADRPATTSITDSNFIPHIVFMVISIVGLILALLFLSINEVFVFKKAKNIARSAFIVK